MLQSPDKLYKNITVRILDDHIILLSSPGSKYLHILEIIRGTATDLRERYMTCPYSADLQISYRVPEFADN